MNLEELEKRIVTIDETPKTPKWDYFVTGRSKETGRYSLVYTCGTRERGEQVLEKAKKEERLLEKYDDFYLERIEYEKAWWNQY